MATFLLAFLIISASLLALGVGVIAGRKPIQGSCGGIACISGADCGACHDRRPGGVR